MAGFFSAVAAARGPLEKLARLQAWLAALSPTEAKYLVRIMTGDLRIGVAEGLVDAAIASAQGNLPVAPTLGDGAKEPGPPSRS